MSVTLLTMQIGNPASNVGTSGTIRYYASQDFTALDGTRYKGGSLDSRDYFLTNTWSVSGGLLTVPPKLAFPTTSDARPGTTRITAGIYDSNGVRHGTLFENLIIPANPSSPLTLLYLQTLSANPQPLRDTVTLSRADFALLLDQAVQAALGTLNNANVGISGRIETASAPADALHPKAVETGDRRVESSYNVKATAIGAIGDGTTNDRAALNTLVNTTLQITGAGGDVYFPPGTYSIGSGMTFPANVRLRFDPRAMLKPANGVTVIVLGSVDAGSILTSAYQIFTNARASQGTISFVGNTVMFALRPEWWGFASGATATINAASLQAASDALTTIGSGKLIFGNGTYNFNATWYIGVNDAAGAFTGIGILGTNGLVGTNLNWTGSTAGTAIEVGRGRRNPIEGIFLTNGVAKGTTVGILFSGASDDGMQTSGPLLNSVGIRGFHYGIQEGGHNGTIGAGAAAEFTTLISCYLDGNDYGYIGASSGNSVGIWFDSIYCTNNAVFGVYVAAGTSTTHIKGGLFGGNGLIGSPSTTGDVGLNLGWNKSVHIEDCRLEVGGGTDAFGGGVVNIAGTGSVFINNIDVTTKATVPAYAILRGAGLWTFESSYLGRDADTAWILYDASGNAGGSITVRNSQVQNSNTRTVPGGGNNTVALGIQFDPSTTSEAGMKIKGEHNRILSGGGTTWHDDIDGIIGITIASTEKVYANRRVDSFNRASSDVYLWTNQDATPSVKWAGVFQTQNSAGTTYTNFLNGVENQTILIYVADANTTFKNNTTIVTRTAADVVATNGFTYSFTFISSKWRQN